MANARLIKNGRGYSLAEILIVLAIGSVVTAGICGVLVLNAKFQSDAWSVNQMMEFREGILNSLSTGRAWNNTLRAPENTNALRCLRLGLPCTVNGQPNGVPIQAQPFAVYNDQNALLYNGIPLTNGIGPQGNLCSTFSAAGNDACPFRYALTWSADCTPGDCINPVIKVSAKLFYTPAKKELSLDTNRYSINNYYLSPFSGAPACQLLTHTSNNKSFTVAWTRGSGNGGAGGCAIQYRQNDGTWANVSSPTAVNCDDDGSAAGTITLPDDGWLGGPWGAPPAEIRLVRLSDNSLMCTLGQLSCVPMPGALVPTPSIDEDCDNRWDNTPNGTCYIEGGLPLAPGDPFTCAPSATYIEAWGDICCTDPSCTGEPVFQSGANFYIGAWVSLLTTDCSDSEMFTDAVDSGWIPSPGTVPSEAMGILPITSNGVCYATVAPGAFRSLKTVVARSEWGSAKCRYSPPPVTEYR